MVSRYVPVFRLTSRVMCGTDNPRSIPDSKEIISIGAPNLRSASMTWILKRSIPLFLLLGKRLRKTECSNVRSLFSLADSKPRAHETKSSKITDNLSKVICFMPLERRRLLPHRQPHRLHEVLVHPNTLEHTPLASHVVGGAIPPFSRDLLCPGEPRCGRGNSSVLPKLVVPCLPACPDLSGTYCTAERISRFS